MSSTISLLIDLFAISICSWAVFGLYSSLRIGRFIVKRYEEETNLTKTKFFVDHVPFTKYLPHFFSSEIYTGHLLISLLAWRFFKQKKVFNDIEDSKEITKYFSAKELRRVKQYAFAAIIFLFHLVVYFIFRAVWPEAFSR